MPQNTLIVNALAILNARTRSIGADILSGLDGKIINAPIIIAAYINGNPILFDDDLSPILVYKKASANALNPDIISRTMYKLCL
jgi:hypothetical protein